MNTEKLLGVMYEYRSIIWFIVLLCIFVGGLFVLARSFDSHNKIDRD